MDSEWGAQRVPAPTPWPSPHVEGPSQPLGACICSPGTPKPHGGKQGQADKWSPFLPPKSPSQGSWHSSWSAASQPGPGIRPSGHPRSRQVTGPGNKLGRGISKPALRVRAKDLNRSCPTPFPPAARIAGPAHTARGDSARGLRGALGHPRSSSQLPSASRCCPPLTRQRTGENSHTLPQPGSFRAQREPVEVLGWGEFPQAQEGLQESCPRLTSTSPSSLLVEGSPPSKPLWKSDSSPSLFDQRYMMLSPITKMRTAQQYLLRRDL